MKVTKWSTFTGEFDVSEQNAEQTRGETGSFGAGPTMHHSSKAVSEPAAVSAPQSADAGSPTLVPEQGGAGETPQVDAAHTEAPKSDAPGKDAPRTPGKLMIMSSGDRAWAGNGDAGPEPEAVSSAG